MKITEHFNLEELTYSSSFPSLIEANKDEVLNNKELMNNITITANMLEKIRDIFKSPIIVYSCYRNEKLNKAVGGVPNSYHKKALAADIVIKNMKVFESFQYILDNFNDFNFIGKVIYENINGAEWLHIQVKLNKNDKTYIFTKYAGKNYHLVKEF